MLRRSFLALAAALALASTGCPPADGTAATGATVRVAFAGPLTGSSAALGNASKKGFELAVKQRNDASGVAGKKVEAVVEDDKGAPAEAGQVAQKLAGDDTIVAVVGHFNSSCSNAGKDTYLRAKLLEFSPGSTSVDFCRGNAATFRNLYHDDYQGVFMARYVKEVLGHTKLAIVFDNDDYGRGLKEAISAKAAEIGITVVATEAYNRDQTQDYKTIATTLQGKGPESIIISGLYNEAALLAKAVRNDLGWANVQLLGSDGVMNPDFVKTAGAAAEGALVVTPFFFSKDSSPEAQAFGNAFRATYNEDPDTWAALAYDAANMTFEAIAAVGAERAKVMEWFATRRDLATGFKGVTGVTYFDAEGDCSKPASVVVVQNGAFGLAPKQLKAD